MFVRNSYGRKEPLAGAGVLPGVRERWQPGALGNLVLGIEGRRVLDVPGNQVQYFKELSVEI